ncbi:MAG: clan AA aspartic protease [Caldilineaceae bacterium]|nr:clan AA aspartic protease [Caldilineaceae bacterium]
MNIRLTDGLPFVRAAILHNQQEIVLDNVLLDTGSAGSIVAADRVSVIGLTYAPEDEVHRIRGVGGVEFVFAKLVERVAIGDIWTENFVIEIGAMDYGFPIDGILGMDFLLAVGAIIDTEELAIYRGAASSALHPSP